jgi:hypothetical protein
VSWKDEAQLACNADLRETDRIVNRGRRLAKQHGWQYERALPCGSLCYVWKVKPTYQNPLKGTSPLFKGSAVDVLAWMESK